MTTTKTEVITTVTAPVIESEPPFDGVLTPDMRIDPAVREWMEVFTR
jgi:hypothetical protein